jgi:hypothetical protein
MMRFLNVLECRVPMKQMQEFTTLVQRWEQDFVGGEGGPRLHAVYLNDADPSRVLVITQFDSKTDSDEFAAGGKLAGFYESVLACTGERPVASEGWDLYYAAGPDGRKTVFGEDA